MPRVALSAVLNLLAIASPAAAHKTDVFAAVRGTRIQGEAHFHDGAPIRNAQVTIVDPAGKKLGETKSDSSGKFSFVAQRRCDHRIVVDAGDGHVAEFTVRAEELPASLPAAAGHVSNVPGASATHSRGSLHNEHGHSHDAREELHEELDAIQAQIVQLRKDLAARDDTARWRDLLGGIGYIVGLMGLAFYFLGRQRRPLPPPDGQR